MAKKGATGDFFFSFLQKKIKFMEEKKKWKKKKFAAARLASILATRWTGNRFFFMDSLEYAGLKITADSDVALWN